ncbi:ABC transporter permease, partial [Deinococcus sp. MIMF12]
AYAGRSRGWPWLWLPVTLAYALAGGLSSWSVWQEGQVEAARLGQELAQHVRLTAAALGLSVLIGGPLAVWSVRQPGAGQVVLAVTGAVQTLPSLALLGLLIAPLGALSQAVPALRSLGVSGIGTAPALVALTLYGLLPVVRNGVAALRGVDAGTLDAGRGMGMTPGQLFWRVQLPLALPVWLAGLRQATVLLIGVTAVAALIGAGGLGVYIFRGLNASATDLILLGALPACLLAIVADAAWRGLEAGLARRLGLTRGAEVGAP